ncbi:MAG: Flp pilus assembly protein CpaB [Candidatus Limnocylindrales bacterium]
MKRSSRLIILVGFILAIGAFAGIIWWGSRGGTSSTGPGATVASTTSVVEAAANIPLGAVITTSEVGVKSIAVANLPSDAYTDSSQVVGRVARQAITSGGIITTADFASGNTAQGDQIIQALKPGFRAMAVEVDQSSGVGTLIQPGDRVDMVIAFNITEYLPQPATGPASSQLPVPLPSQPVSVKDILQNLEVLGTLTAPATTSTNGQTTTQAAAAPGAPVGLTGQQMIVILAVTAQQAEIIKYAQVEAVSNTAAGGANMPISLILRAPADASAPPDKTSGIVLKTLIDQYGVLPPALLQGTLPSK